MEMEKKYESDKILIPLFFEEVLKSFSFLSSDLGYNTEWGIDSWENGKLRKVNKESINDESWYLSVVRFCKNKTTLAIKYGERESIVSATITYGNNTYGLWELIHAINPKEKRNIGNSWVLNSNFLIRTIKELQNVTQDYWNQIEYPSVELLTKVKEERNERHKRHVQAERKNEIERACYRAGEEFQKKNYVRTIEILKEYESELPKSALLKLQYARKHK
jgi:hypothetical protein